MKREREIVPSRRGMNRDVHPSNLSKEDYSFALNTNYLSEGGDGLPMLQNEPSNLLCRTFGDYKVLGYKHDVNSGGTYFFITNPEVGDSKICYIPNENHVEGDTDVITKCGCNSYGELGQSLEDVEQQEHCDVECLVEDTCNLCLNFNINHPIHYVALKDEKCGKRLYWTDNYNPPRYIDLDNLEIYSYLGEENCEGGNPPTCLDCEKMRIFKRFTKPCLSVETIEYGGNLNAGTYEFLVAYSDSNGNELSKYYSITQPVSIFDPNRITLNQTELAYQSNYGIRLKVEGLDTKYAFYKVAVIQRADVNNVTSYFIEGLHPINDTTILYTTSDGKERVTLQDISQTYPHFEKTEIMTSTNGYLFQAGLTSPKELNLQPVVNLMGGFLRWNTSIAREGLYKDGSAVSKYRGYMRGEVYPFSIRFFLKDGRETANFILPNRPASSHELEDVTTLDTESVQKFAPECSDEIRSKRWQFYNTASKLGVCEFQDGLEYIQVESEIVSRCVVSDVAELASHSFFVPEPIIFTDTVSYIRDNLGEITNPSSDLYDPILSSILENEYPSSHCDVNPGQDCDPPVIQSYSVGLQSLASEQTELIPKPIEDYGFLNTLGLSNVWVSGEDNGYEEDTQFMQDFLDVGETAYVRLEAGVGESCLGARQLNTTFQNNASDVLQYAGGLNLGDVQTTNPSCPSSGFSDFVHKGARWYTSEIPPEGLVFEVSPQRECTSPDTVSVGTELRYTIYDGCGGAIVTCGTFDPLDGLQVLLDASDFSGEVSIVIDSPYLIKLTMGVPVFLVTPPCSSMVANVREVEYLGTQVQVDGLVFSKEEVYKSTCRYNVPQVGSCDAYPYEYGKFGYYESLEKYPCNKELYDSSNLTVRRDDLPEELQSEFEEYYVETISSGTYTLRDDTDLTDSPIRHYRFPDNCISPFMGVDDNLPFQESYIYPIGVQLDNSVINTMLDIAVTNGLVTLEQRNSITNYEIYRGDRRLDRGVLAKGLVYDMYRYQEGEDDRYYSNYPYNDLGEDRYNYIDEDRQDYIPHPMGGLGNSRFTFHSPDVHFEKPALPPEVHFEAYQMGNSRGRFVDVDDHSEWVVLGQAGYTIATALGAAEAAFELAVVVGNAFIESSKNYYIGFIGVNPAAPVGTGFALTISILAASVQIFQKAGEYRYNWLKILRENGKSTNFAKYYASEGYYNKLLQNCDEGNMFRGLAASKYLKSGNYKVGEPLTGENTTINNFHRESSVYLSTSEDYPVMYDPEYVGYDNNSLNYGASSRYTSSEAGVCANQRSDEVTRNIGSPYVSLRRWLPSQYGEVSSIRWLNTSYCGDLLSDNNCEVVYGGDVFISRFGLKRKIPFFYVNAVGLANFTPFEYYSQRNIGYPRYYADYAVSQRTGLAGAIFPDIGDEVIFDCEEGAGSVYYRKPSHFYLFSYGIPQFLVESEINVNYRYARRELHEQFYPEVGDYVDWTQEQNVTIKEDNTFHYNDAYSKEVTILSAFLLPDNYNKEEYDCRFDAPNGVIYSRQDVSETDLSDPWLVYRSSDYYQFPTSLGKLVDLRGIESSQVFARFENGTTLFNAVDQLRDRLTPENYLLGSGGIFASRPIDTNVTDLGYSGSQHRAMVSCEFGHFWVDVKRGGVFQVDPNGAGFRPITQGMSQWFKRHLPFKILKEGVVGLESTDVDNNYKGLGIAMGWDMRFQRVFLTKKDKKIQPSFKGRVSYVNGDFLLDGDLVIDINDDLYFEDVSFTLAYFPLTQTWISYYSFHPDFYIPMLTHFKTGLNYPKTGELGGLWSHLLTNRSYQVFYGKLHPWVIELPVPEIGSPRILETIRYWMDTRRYHNEWDFAEKRSVGFNKAWLYNNSQNTGQLNLIHGDPKNMRQRWEYPKVISNTEEDILVTEQDMRWVFNDLRNRVDNELSNVPIWLWDSNQVNKSLNADALNYRRPLSERLRGDWLLLRLMQDKDSRFHQIFKFLDLKSRVYD